VARVRHSFEIDLQPSDAQRLFLRDILPSIYKGSAFRLADEHPGLIVLRDGVIDPNQTFDTRRAAGAGPPKPEHDGDAQPRRRRSGILAPNVEHRQPWLYTALRRLTSRNLTIHFDAQEGRTRVRIAGSADGRLRDALARLGSSGQWPEMRN
jgi:hypothetical protein